MSDRQSSQLQLVSKLKELVSQLILTPLQTSGDKYDELVEQRDLILALALAWLRVRRDHWQAEYKVAAIEPEIKTTLYEDNNYKVFLQSRPDVIAERLDDGALLQWELKSAKLVTQYWAPSWEHNLQLVGQQLAIEEWARANERDASSVGGACVEALLKGRREKDKDTGIQRHQTALIYAYVSRGDGLLVPDQLSQTWKRGWQKELVSKHMPLEQWVLQQLPLEEVVNKIVVVPPIKPSRWEIEQASEQWGLAAIANYEQAMLINNTGDDSRRAHLLNKYFPQNTSQCWQFGKCRFFDLCFNPAMAEDPLGSGFVMREPNHPMIVDEE
jgi:hypothetical protein